MDIQPHDLQNIYHSREDFLTEKIKSILNIQNIGDNIEKIENYFNKILGNKQIIFHGTTSTMEKFFSGNNDKNYVVIKPCLAIDNIYRQHEIYCAFQGGISDYNNNNFWVTTSPSSACFYSLQSPEYFARFASRSDYYKQDIYKYDRIAYYRKDYRACLRNVKKEIREFKFNSREKNVILKNFKIMWNNIVFADMKNIILYKVISCDNEQHFTRGENVMEMLLKYFRVVHFRYNSEAFKKDFNKISLPDIKLYLKRQHPINNQKFVICEKNKNYTRLLCRLQIFYK